MIYQGHRYCQDLIEVLALETGEGFIRVADIQMEHDWPLDRPRIVHSAGLVAMPMRYFGNCLPT